MFWNTWDYVWMLKCGITQSWFCYMLERDKYENL